MESLEWNSSDRSHEYNCIIIVHGTWSHKCRAIQPLVPQLIGLVVPNKVHCTPPWLASTMADDVKAKQTNGNAEEISAENGVVEETDTSPVSTCSASEEEGVSRTTELEVLNNGSSL